MSQTTNPATGEPTAPATNPATGEPTATAPSDTTGAADSSEAPASPVFTAPTESNRLDPSAPSALRTEIDPTNPGSAATNPAAESSNPNAPGLPYNSLAQTQPTGPTTSPGLGVTPTPSPNSPSVYPTPLPTPRPLNTFPSTQSPSSFGSTNRGFSSPGLSSGSRPMSGSRR